MTLLEGFAKHDDDERFVFHLVLCILESFERDPDFHRLKLYAALERPDLVQVSRRILGMQLFKLMSSYVARRQKAGVFRKGPPELLAFGIMARRQHFHSNDGAPCNGQLRRPLRIIDDSTAAGLSCCRALRPVANHLPCFESRPKPELGRSIAPA